MVQIIIGFVFVVFLIFLSFGVELKDAAKYTLVLMLVIGGIVFWWVEEEYKDHFVFAVKNLFLKSFDTISHQINGTMYTIASAVSAERS